MVVCLMRHASPTKNRAGILKAGLEVRKPSEHNWCSMESQPEGVYLSFVGQEGWDQGAEEDEYRVWITGPMFNDEEMWTPTAILGIPVPPDKMELYAPASI